MSLSYHSLCFPLILDRDRWSQPLEELLTTSPRDVASIFKLEENEAKELMADVARKYIECRGLAKYVHELQPSVNSHFSVGDAGWDTFLGGGFPMRGITEIVGPAGSGKTQLALQLTLAVQLPKEKGGLGGSKSKQYSV